MGLAYGYPRGAYYILIDVRSTSLAAREFARVLRDEAQVLVGVAGSTSGNEGFIRGSLAVPYDKLEEGLERMAGIVDRYQR